MGQDECGPHFAEGEAYGRGKCTVPYSTRLKMRLFIFSAIPWSIDFLLVIGHKNWVVEYPFGP